MEIENMTFEQLMKELTEVVEKLESGKLSLEDSVTIYQRGVSLSLECKKRLDNAKQVVVKKVSQTNSEETM